MRRLALIVGVAGTLAVQAAAADNRFERSLRLLSPTDRLIQLCDYTAMQRIRAESREYRPDRAVADATAEPRIVDNTIHATGGAFRSRKKWYAMSYTCATSPDNMKVLSFNFKIGGEIPEDKWATYGLWQ